VNTLLEPSNNNSTAQNITDEIKEVSNQLNMIKKKHDDTKKLSILKQVELDRTIEEKK
jgi:ABC-type dipeptide/oligopeptide/nickel transport system ATPase subunit